MADSGASMLHSYRVTVQGLSSEGQLDDRKALCFDVTNHDELFALVERVAERGIVHDGEAAEFTVGLKLFSEVLLRHRREPLFAGFFAHFGAFMLQLKRGTPPGTEQAGS